MSRPVERTELVTATGMRLVGKAAGLVSPAAAAGIEAPRREEDVLYAGAFHLLPRRANDAIAAALSVINATIAGSRTGTEPLTRSNGVSEFGGRFQAVQWETLTAGDRWVGELIWRHAHPAIAGIACTTHVVFSERGGGATMTVRVGTVGGVASVRGFVGAGQARPAFLPELNRAVKLVFEGRGSEPGTLTDADIRAFVANVLLDEERMIPVAVQAPTEDGEYLVPPASLADELLGVAHLFVIDRHPTTYRLTDELGDRRLSAYWGALHVYLPGFSCADSAESHPLLVDDRLVDPVMRAGLVGQLSLHMRRRVLEPEGVAELREASSPRAAKVAPAATHAGASAPPAASLVPTTEAVPVRDASAPEVSASAVPEIAVAPSPHLLDELLLLLRPLADLPAALSRLAESNAALVDEISRLRTTNAVRSASASSLERQVGDLERLLRAHVAAATSSGSAGATIAPTPVDETEPVSSGEGAVEQETPLAEVVRHAATTNADALLVLDDAVRSAEDSPYLDVNRVAVILDAMASLARRRQAGTLGMSLRDAFRELGVDYRGSIAGHTSNRQRLQYVAHLPNGAQVDCEEHLVLGTSYDPRYCLRIYFTSRAPGEPRFVVRHVGRHFDVGSTT